MSEKSSRSHLIILFKIIQKNLNEHVLKTGKFIFVDLAGSESLQKNKIEAPGYNAV